MPIRSAVMRAVVTTAASALMAGHVAAAASLDFDSVFNDRGGFRAKPRFSAAV